MYLVIDILDFFFSWFKWFEYLKSIDSWQLLKNIVPNNYSKNVSYKNDLIIVDSCSLSIIYYNLIND